MRAHRLELAYDALDDGGLAARLISHMAKAGVNRVAGLHRLAAASSASGVIAEAGRAARLRFPRARLPRLRDTRRDGADLEQGFGAELVEERS